jgi:predicted nucleic acid-binding Zn ribbon protein
MRRRNSEQVGEVIRKILRMEGLETPLNQYRLVDAWKDVVGQGIANYTQQIYVKNQTLFVHLTSPVLRQELMMTRQILVRRLNEKAGAQVITDIVFR